MADTVILLSAYNGTPFLGEQLESLRAQEAASRLTLFWRDDGSTDASPELLRRFDLGGGVIEAPAMGQRLGALRSFMALLRASPEAEFYAFCDQDDVWLPPKMSRARAALSHFPAGRPALYCGRQQLVDETLRPIGLSPQPHRPLGFGNALAQNVATGCTMVLNDAARRLVCRAAPPPEGSLHDWWCYLLVTGAGGEVVFDPEPLILYRQHGRNAVGATPSLPHRALGALRRGPQDFLRVFRGHLDALSRSTELLTPSAAQQVGLLRSSQEAGLLRRLSAIRRAGLYRQTMAEDLALLAWFALGGAARA